MSALPPPTAPRDPLLERLERLAERRSGIDASSVPGRLAPPRTPSKPPSGSSPSSRTAAPSPRQPRRRHPARVARLGALVMSCASAGGLAYLFQGINTTQAATSSLDALPAPVATASTATTAAPARTAAPASSSPAVATPATPATTAVPTTAVPTTAAASATIVAYNGNIVNTRYGPVQVQVQITDGAISEVAVVEYPDGDNKSVRINARALPRLRTEALTAQSATIDTVSGATYTSDAYTVSLQSAIDQARAAGTTALA